MTSHWDPYDAELADTLEHALKIRTRYLTTLEEVREAAEPTAGLATLPFLISSSAATEPSASPPVEADAGPAGGTDGGSPSGPSKAALASISTARLRGRVRRSMEAHGPHHANWSARENAEWRELVVVRREAA